jgi:hypothetical protein
LSVNEVDNPEITKWDSLFTELLINTVTPVIRRWFRPEVGARFGKLPVDGRRFAGFQPFRRGADPRLERPGHSPVRHVRLRPPAVYPCPLWRVLHTVSRIRWGSTIGFPFGLTVFFPANILLPAKIVYQVLEPFDIVAQFDKDDDAPEVDSYVRSTMQTALDRLRSQRRFPVPG